MVKMLNEPGYPRCFCDDDVMAVHRRYRDGSLHWWLQCGGCGKYGSSAVPAHSIPPLAKELAHVGNLEELNAQFETMQGGMSIFGELA